MFKVSTKAHSLRTDCPRGDRALAPRWPLCHHIASEPSGFSEIWGHRIAGKCQQGFQVAEGEESRLKELVR